MLEIRYLEKILEKYKKIQMRVWSGITTNQGSVSHLDFLTEKKKMYLKLLLN